MKHKFSTQSSGSEKRAIKEFFETANRRGLNVVRFRIDNPVSTVFRVTATEAY